ICAGQLGLVDYGAPETAGQCVRQDRHRNLGTCQVPSEIPATRSYTVLPLGESWPVFCDCQHKDRELPGLAVDLEAKAFSDQCLDHLSKLGTGFSSHRRLG